jgi:hypothetical protein
MDSSGRVSTGVQAVDRVIDSLRLGDNVVWQVDSMDDYRAFVTPFVDRALAEGRRVVYIHFGDRAPLCDQPGIALFPLEAGCGFECFASAVNAIITSEGRGAFYVFDCLTDLLNEWCSDLMIGNFFRITCPYLFMLDTVAYFALLRGRHSFEAIARIRETTQLLIDLYNIEGEIYLHPLKVWERYSPTMFLPHRPNGDIYQPVTASGEAAKLFSRRLEREAGSVDYWDRLFLKAHEMEALPAGDPEAEALKKRIIQIQIAREPRIAALAARYMSLSDLLGFKAREIGTGLIGGKSAGMLLARAILSENGFDPVLETHDSYYLGADVFYTYLVHNDCWRLRMEQNTPEGYFALAGELGQRLLNGSFPHPVRQQFLRMLDYFGQSPIIVRSSSLLEDNFGNAFAGEYDSIFLTNQGPPEQRSAEFEQAVKRVYASMMSPDALEYRMQRGLLGRDEQMSLLVQRVSGDRRDKWFFPLLAGVGNSYNLYVWDGSIDPEAGMIRLVFGLGTRAVDRVSGDYPRIVSLNRPLLCPCPPGERAEYSQRHVDALSLTRGRLEKVYLPELLRELPDMDMRLFGEDDREAQRRARELGLPPERYFTLTFEKLLKETGFADRMRRILNCLATAYEYPVDVEFSANIDSAGELYVNVLQCRPQQTRGVGAQVVVPEAREADTVLRQQGGFMGGNVRMPLDAAVLVDAAAYGRLGEQDKYAVAREVGRLNALAAREKLRCLLIGPGRWGTTTPSLGVPVRFTEIAAMAALMEVAAEGFSPELSYGSHFFQDIVESDIFYAGVFPGLGDALFQPRLISRGQPIPVSEALSSVVQAFRVPLWLYADVVSQKVLCVARE